MGDSGSDRSWEANRLLIQDGQQRTETRLARIEEKVDSLASGFSSQLHDISETSSKARSDLEKQIAVQRAKVWAGSSVLAFVSGIAAKYIF